MLVRFRNIQQVNDSNSNNTRFNIRSEKKQHRILCCCCDVFDFISPLPKSWLLCSSSSGVFRLLLFFFFAVVLVFCFGVSPRVKHCTTNIKASGLHISEEIAHSFLPPGKCAALGRAPVYCLSIGSKKQQQIDSFSFRVLCAAQHTTKSKINDEL